MADPRPAERADPSPAGRRAIPMLEWVIGVLGALIVAALVGYLVWSAVARDETPPDVRLEVLDIQDLPEGYLVRFAAENQGSQAAAALLIEGELELPDGQTETGEATIDYLPPRSTREGALVFRNDPVSGDLTVRPKGFTRP